MNMQELKELIYQGEKVDIECKKAEKNVPKSAYESYSAFANTKGGYIILGVREDKTKTDPKVPVVFEKQKVHTLLQVITYWVNDNEYMIDFVLWQG